MIDGVTYQMNQNHHENNLHSGDRGFDVVVWDAQFDENEPGKIKFHYISKDMEQNLPGNFDVTVTYKLLEDNTLSIVYDAETDKTTLANMTTHIYYNLNGHDNGNIGGHELMIPASLYTPMIDEKAIPTGVNKDVTDTPFDFFINKSLLFCASCYYISDLLIVLELKKKRRYNLRKVKIIYAKLK